MISENVDTIQKIEDEIAERKTFEKERKFESDMIEEWLSKNEPTICKDFKPESKNKGKKSKNKNFVSDRAYASGKRKGEAV